MSQLNLTKASDTHSPWKSVGVMLTEERRVLWGDGGGQGGAG